MIKNPLEVMLFYNIKFMEFYIKSQVFNLIKLFYFLTELIFCVEWFSSEL